MRIYTRVASNRVEPSNAPVDIIFHRLERIAVQSLWSITVRIVSVAWRTGEGRGLAEERDDIITIINPECRSLCQAVARGRILSTNAAHPRPGPTAFSPSACQPLLGDTVHARRRISVWLANFTTQEPGEGRRRRRLRRGFQQGGRDKPPNRSSFTPALSDVGLEQGTIIFGDRA